MITIRDERQCEAHYQNWLSVIYEILIVCKIFVMFARYALPSIILHNCASGKKNNKKIWKKFLLVHFVTDITNCGPTLFLSEW